jgi:hypothetical protein
LQSQHSVVSYSIQNVFMLKNTKSNDNVQILNNTKIGDWECPIWRSPTVRQQTRYRRSFVIHSRPLSSRRKYYWEMIDSFFELVHQISGLIILAAN